MTTLILAPFDVTQEPQFLYVLRLSLISALSDDETHFRWRQATPEEVNEHNAKLGFDDDESFPQVVVSVEFARGSEGFMLPFVLMTKTFHAIASDLLAWARGSEGESPARFIAKFGEASLEVEASLEQADGVSTVSFVILSRNSMTREEILVAWPRVSTWREENILYRGSGLIDTKKLSFIARFANFFRWSRLRH